MLSARILRLAVVHESAQYIQTKFNWHYVKIPAALVTRTGFEEDYSAEALVEVVVVAVVVIVMLPFLLVAAS